MADLNKLPPRERQIMDFLLANSGGTVADVLDGIKDPPSYSAVRAMLAKLEKKGYVTHGEVDRTYYYRPVAKEQARRTAVRHLIDSLFNGSTTQAVAALLKSDDDISDAELAALEQLVAAHRRGGRK
jgi:BlaI family transcriptional regulator, penicillinase repressor